MSVEPKISIVLPTYNGARYLAQSIQSCLNQTLQDLELIVVDDCSTDTTPQIIADFAAKDARLQVVRNESNRRLPASINAGLSRSRGCYLSWTSDDNLYRPNAMAEMVAALEEDSSMALVYAPMTYIDDSGHLQGPGYSGGPPDQLAYRNPVGACFLYRREVYETIGGYAEDLFLVEDWDYWIRVAERFHLRALSSDLYLYRLHDNSLSRQRQANVWRAQRQLLERHLPQMNWASRAARGHGYLVAARIAWRCGDRRDAWRLMQLAFAKAPAYTLKRLIGEPFDLWRKTGKSPGTMLHAKQ